MSHSVITHWFGPADVQNAFSGVALPGVLAHPAVQGLASLCSWGAR